MVIFHKMKSIGYPLRARHVSDRFSVVKKQDWMKDLSLCYVDKQRKNLGPCSGIQEPSCCCLVTKLCLTLCKPMDCCLPGSSVHGISQARILEWLAISFSRGSSWPRNWTCVSLTGRQILYHQGSITRMQKTTQMHQGACWKMIRKPNMPTFIFGKDRSYDELENKILSLETFYLIFQVILHFS